MASTDLFRICPRTGLQYHKSTEPLIKLNAVEAVVALLVGGVLALRITLTRWQAVHLVGAHTFYMILTAHGLDMLVVWIIFFEVAVLYLSQMLLKLERPALVDIALKAKNMEKINATREVVTACEELA